MPSIAGNSQFVGLCLSGAPIDVQSIEDFGLSMTSRSLRPLPPRMRMTMRWLSISLAFNYLIFPSGTSAPPAVRCMHLRSDTPTTSLIDTVSEGFALCCGAKKNQLL